MEKEIREKILDIMEKENISYGELSRRTDLSKSTLQRYLTKEDAKVPIDRLRIMANGLNTTVSYLMGWDKNNNKRYVFDHIVPMTLANTDDELKKLLSSPINIQILSEDDNLKKRDSLESVSTLLLNDINLLKIILIYGYMSDENKNKILDYCRLLYDANEKKQF